MIWPWQRSIGVRIVVILVGLLAVVLLLLNIVMAKLLLRAELEETANHLQIQALVAAQTLQDPLSGYARELDELESEHHRDHDDDEDKEHHKEDQGVPRKASLPSVLPQWAKSFERDSRTDVLVTDLEGRTLAGDGPAPLTQELVETRAKRPFHRYSDTTIYACAPIAGRGNRVAGMVRLGLPRAAADSRSHTLIASFGLISAGALFLALLAAIWLSRRLVQPLRDLERQAHKAAQGEWEQPVELSGQDELASLSRAFSVMLLELQAMLEKQRLFISHASHELRTPLTRIKLRTEALIDGALEDSTVSQRFVQEIDAEIDRLGRLATTLLDLGRLDHGPSMQTTPDPLAVLRATVERSLLSATEAGLELQVHLPPTLPAIRLGSDALDSVFANLLDNAIKFTPRGGTIDVSARAGDQGALFEVSDTGIGIDSQHLPHIFDRFFRADIGRAAGGGAGLGLSLVKAIVQAACGEISVSSAIGEGTCFTVVVPWSLDA